MLFPTLCYFIKVGLHLAISSAIVHAKWEPTLGKSIEPQGIVSMALYFSFRKTNRIESILISLK